MKKLLTYFALILLSMFSSADENTTFENTLSEFEEKGVLSESFIKSYLKRPVYGDFYLKNKRISDNYIALDINNSNGVGFFNFLYTFNKAGEKISNLSLTEESDCDGGEWKLINSAWKSDTELSKITTTINSCYTREFIYEIKAENYKIDTAGVISEVKNGKCPAKYFDSLSKLKVSDRFFSTLDKEQSRLLRNSIFAYHGYTFKSELLDNYFSGCPWYKSSKKFSTKSLNEVEIFNISKFKQFESAR